MGKKTTSRGIIKDVAVVVIGVLVIWIGLQVAFGTPLGSPFYVVASGSMVPALEVNDILIISGHEQFESLGLGDIIVFDRPSDHSRVIVHRVASVMDEDPRTLRTKGDANPASIPGTDFPITEKEYIGKVVYTIPQIGYITQLLKPPINYIIIVIVIGALIAKQFINKKPKPDTGDTADELSEIGEMEGDGEYFEPADLDKKAGEPKAGSSRDGEESEPGGSEEPSEYGQNKPEKKE